jgi:hypothetical protein
MRQFIALNALLFLTTTFCLGQMEAYDSIAKIANRHYDSLDYKNAVSEYRNAFSTLGGKGMPADRYKAAKAWAQLSVNDSAFFNLLRLADKTDYLEFHKLKAEKEFTNLHDDKRWNELLLRLNPRQEVYNDSLAKILEKIQDDDQKYRLQLDSVQRKFGFDSKEYYNFWRTIDYQDSIDLKKIIDILDTYGWLSVVEVGKEGNQALWLVIQHAALAVQEKYFPVMQKAVTEGKASKRDLAYLEDRILMRQGKKQLYGTQYRTDTQTNTNKLWDVEDPDNLNNRRASVGLAPMKNDK